MSARDEINHVRFVCATNMRNSVQAELPAWSVSPQGRSILAGNFEEVSELKADKWGFERTACEIELRIFGQPTFDSSEKQDHSGK